MGIIVKLTVVKFCMMTWSNGNIFRVTGHLCGEFTGPGEFPTQRRSFDVFFDLRLNKRLSKQWWGLWFETLSCPLWRHRNGLETGQHWKGKFVSLTNLWPLPVQSVITLPLLLIIFFDRFEPSDIFIRVHPIFINCKIDHIVNFWFETWRQRWNGMGVSLTNL